jgi:hypothetical protein
LLPIRWTTPETVSNDSGSVEQVCDWVRWAWPVKAVRRSQLFEAQVGGHVQAEHLREIAREQRSPPTLRCSARERAPELVAPRERRLPCTLKAAGAGTAEFVNADRYFDNDAPMSQPLAMRMRAIGGVRLGELEQAPASSAALSRRCAPHLVHLRIPDTCDQLDIRSNHRSRWQLCGDPAAQESRPAMDFTAARAAQ